jgi:hypothetical protein
MPTAALPESENCNCFAVRSAARYATQLYDLFLAPIGLRVTQFFILEKLKRRGCPDDQYACGSHGDGSHDVRARKRDRLIRIGPAPSDRRAKAWAKARFEAGFGARRVAELAHAAAGGHCRPIHVDSSSHEPVKRPCASQGHAL